MGRVDEFLAEMTRIPALTLEELNDTFSVRLDMGYNSEPHGALDGRTPTAVFAADSRPLRPVDQRALRDAFLREETRKVDKTGCLKFRGTLCEIGARYAGKRVTVRYADLPGGPHGVETYDGDRLIGPVRPLEWNRAFDAVDPSSDATCWRRSASSLTSTSTPAPPSPSSSPDNPNCAPPSNWKPSPPSPSVSTSAPTSPHSPRRKAPAISPTTSPRPAPTRPLFTEPALRLLHAHAGGLPRQLNNLAHACLLYAYGQQRQLIDDAIVKAVLDNEFA